MGENVSEPGGQDELFDATPYDIEAKARAEAAETIAGIAARNAELARDRDEQRSAEKAAQPIPETAQERIKQRSDEILERVRRDNEDVNAEVSEARRDETSESLVSTEASVEGAARIEAAQKAVESAAAQAGAAEAAEKKAAAIEAAHAGAQRARQVLEAISDDRKQSPLDKALERVTIAEARALAALELVESKMEATPGNPPASLRAAYRDIKRKHEDLVLKQGALKELIERNKARAREIPTD